MRKFTLLSAGLLSLCFSAFAAPVDDVTVNISPDPTAQYETLPMEYTLTFEGVTDLAKASAIASNPVKITAPSGTAQQLTATISGNQVVLKVPATTAMPLDEAGEYTVLLQPDKYKWTNADGEKVTNVSRTWTYNVTGNGGGGDEDNSVKYDLQVSFSPKIQPEFDASQRKLESLQIIVNTGEVQPLENATVSIQGPGYYMIGNLDFAMGNATTTWLKTELPAGPRYNGTYTLTIAKGSFGTPAWIENPETGRTNDEIKVEFEVIGALPASEMTVDTSIGIFYNPALNTKVENLRDLTLTFSEPVVYDENATISVGQLPDLAMTAYQDYGTAKFIRISDTEVGVEFEKNINVFGGVILRIPEGFFHTADFDADNHTGKCNPAQNPEWVVSPKVVYVQVVKTEPANEAILDEIPTGYQIVIFTDNNDEVASMTFSMIRYALGDELAAPKTILDEVTSDERTADTDVICWTNNGEPIVLSEGYYYEIVFNLFNKAEINIGDGIISINGSALTAVEEVGTDAEGKTIYSIQGTSVNATLEELPAGIYIVNGKKIIVR